MRGTWPPALNIFLTLLERGKLDDSRKMSNGELLTFEKVYPLDAAYDELSQVPEDVRDQQALPGRRRLHHRRMVSRLQEDFGEKPLDIVVHSLANAPEVRKGLLETTRAGYLTAVSVSAYSMVSLVSRLGPLMRAPATFLSLSYLAAERVIPGYGGGMSSAKAALESDTRTLAYEAGANSAPGSTPSPPARSLLRAATAIGDHRRDHGLLLASTRRCPESSRPKRSARAAAFLLSPLASGITGTTIYVDKGYHAMGRP